MPMPTRAKRPVGRTIGDPTMADDVRRAAYQVDQAVRRLAALTGDPLWKPGLLTGPTLADLRDARDRLDALLPPATRDAPEGMHP